MRFRTGARVGMLAAGALGAAAAWSRWQSDRILERHPAEGQFVDIGLGRRLHYVIRGSGPPVVLLHGATAQLQDMTTTLMPILAERHTVVAFDRPGHGYSDRLPYHAWDVAQARAIHAGVCRLGLERPVIVGHSMGGGIAMAYGMEYPDELSGIVFLSGLAFPMFNLSFLTYVPPALPVVGAFFAHSVYAPLRRRIVDSSLKRFFHPQATPDTLLRDTPIEMLYRPESLKANSEDQMMVVGSMADLALHYDSYPLPVTVMVGTEDQTTDPHYHGIALASRLPDARLVVFKGLGHMIHHFEQRAIADAVEDVFERAAKRLDPVFRRPHQAQCPGTSRTARCPLPDT
jgi:pimeloyl-ACP methyl ester carboxylesterase